MIQGEPIMREALLRAARANAKARRRPLAYISRLAYGDARFFGRLARRSVTFTAAKYDELMAWFVDRDNWPDGQMPVGVVKDVFSNRETSNG